MDSAALHRRAREKGVRRPVYWLFRAVLHPFFLVYFRLSRTGLGHVPATGPVIIAANHRSFLDPFVLGLIARRPLYYVAKRELFAHRWLAWILSALGAFPVERGKGDRDMVETAKAILERGDAVLMFPEGTRVRPGPLGSPRRGVGRLALETGAPVVPVAIIGTEAVRRGWRVRPHKVRVRVGPPLTFPKVPEASPQLAAAVTDRIWPCVMLQWEWLGGLPPLRRAAVVGAGSWGTAVAAVLARAGIEVELAPRTPQAAAALERAALPPEVRPARAAQLELSRHDLVVFAVPASALPAAVAELGSRIAPRTAVLVRSDGLVAPFGTRPSAYVAERTLAARIACLAGPAPEPGSAVVVAAADRGLARQLRDAFGTAGLDVGVMDDVVGVELAAAATKAATLAAGAASVAGAGAAGAAAGRVFGEVDALARAEGSSDGRVFTGVAGAGHLVAAVTDAGSWTRRAGELLGEGVAPRELRPASEAVETVRLLAGRAAAAGVDAPALTGLAELIEGHLDPGAWTASLTAPARRTRGARAA